MNRGVKVKLWGTVVGYLGYAPGQSRDATFEYDPTFMKSGIQISPVRMAYPPERFTFSSISEKSFQGLPGIVADSLPDRYGNQLIDIFMAEKGFDTGSITALDRLLYVADRSMGALEYHPGETLSLQRTALDIHRLAELADLVQGNRDMLHQRILSQEDRVAALSLIRVGSSAGGARSKALVALSRKGKLFDGTVSHGVNYSYWLLKFDSSGNRDRDALDPPGMPVVEYIYSIMARDAGIQMPRTRLWDCGNVRHFMIERFDRTVRSQKLDKLHFASWAGIAHADRDGVNSYEQLVLLLRQMKLGQAAVTEIFRRAVFNVLGRNQDDHSKNTGFLMDRSGKWTLAPAYDLTYAYDPGGRWTRSHQCFLGGKNDGFTLRDLLDFGRFCNLDERVSRRIIQKIGDSLGQFSALADKLDLSSRWKRTVESNMRLGILRL